MTRTLLPGILLALLSSHSLATEDNLRERYQANQVRVETNADAQPEGLFSLAGPLSIKAPSAAAMAGAGQQRDPALALARQFFAENPTLLAAGPDDLLLHRRDTDAFGNQHLRFYRLIDGLPVRDMEVLVHLDKNHTVTGINGEIVRPSQALQDHMRLRTGDLLSRDQALARVAALRTTAAASLRLLKADTWLFNEAPHIRWLLDLNPAEGGRYRYWLDAETGELVSVTNSLRLPIPFKR